MTERDIGWMEASGSDFSRDALALIQQQNKSIATEVAPTERAKQPRQTHD